MDSLNKINSKLQTAINNKLWGEVTIKFIDGKPTFIATVEQIKLN